jgi:hypothetical protein
MTTLFAALLLATAPYAVITSGGREVKAPLFSDEYAALPVATVEGQPITLQNLATALAGTHESRKEGGPQQAKDFTPVLDRLIGARLVLLEAHEMGLEELPEFKADIAAFEEMTVRQLVQQRAIRDVKPDPAQVERLFRDLVREWKIRSALFAKEEDANAFSLAARGGGNFDELAKQAVAAKKAEGDLQPQILTQKTRMLPLVERAVKELDQGKVSRPLRVEKGWAVLIVDEVRYPENAEARELAESQSRGIQGAAALRRYYDQMVRKYAKIDDKLLKKLDFEAAKPGFAALEKDQRVLVRIKGDAPLTVADLAAAFRKSFFHGVEQAIKEKKLNPQKASLLDALLSRRVVALEAKRLEIRSSAEYQRRVAEHREETLFGFFVDRAVAPDISVPEAEGLAEYEKHKSDYSYPEFYKIWSIAFTSAKAAEKAAARLRSGTDFRWLKSNAEEQLDPQFRTVDYGGEIVIATSMDADLAKAVAGGRSGDVRIWSPSKAQHYVLWLQEATPKRPQPYQEVRADIIKKLYSEHLTTALDAWIAKLRKAHDVKVYISRIGT